MEKGIIKFQVTENSKTVLIYNKMKTRAKEFPVDKISKDLMRGSKIKYFEYDFINGILHIGNETKDNF